MDENIIIEGTEAETENSFYAYVVRGVVKKEDFSKALNFLKEKRPEVFSLVSKRIQEIFSIKKEEDIAKIFNEFPKDKGGNNIKFFVRLLRTSSPELADKLKGWILEAEEDMRIFSI